MTDAVSTLPAEGLKHVSIDRDYVLGTDETEVRRLGIQHEAWRPVALDCWRRAGVKRGRRVLDVGAGPGYAAFDLAKLVGGRGRVTAVERSARFAEAGRAEAAARGLRNVDFVELDAVSDPLPEGPFDAVWCRWLTSFVDGPEALVDKIALAVRPGGTVMFHEYVDYASWRFSPSLPLMEDYIRRVMRSWREEGGDPDVATRIPPRLAMKGFIFDRVEPLVFCIRPGQPLWTWISTFVGSNLRRLVELGGCDAEYAGAVQDEFTTAEKRPSQLMITPMVLEIVARRPDRTVITAGCCQAPQTGSSL